MFKTFLAVGLATAAQFDPPDLKLELELHRQFRRGEVDSTPSLLAKDAYLESYRLQKGENLWSLSQLLYGDGNYWPRVWSQNPGISDPNLIRPGHTLQFIMGSEDDTPAFRITEQDSDATLELIAANQQASGATVQIPPPEILPRPLIRIPGSFPEWQTITKQPPLNSLDDSRLGLERAKIPHKLFLSGYVQEEMPQSVGAYLESEKESSLPVQGEYIYVKVKKGQGQIGQKYLVIEMPSELKRSSDDLEERGPVYLVQIYGEIQLTEMAKAEFSRSRDREGFDCFRALLLKTTGLNVKGLALIPGQLGVVDLSAVGPKGQSDAQVIGSQRGASSVLYGPGDIVFLNRGSQQGLAEGQILDLYNNRTQRYAETPVKYSPVATGKLKIVRVTPTLATAVVLSAIGSIMQSDRVQTSALNGDVPFTGPSGTDSELDSGGELEGDSLEPAPAPAPGSDPGFDEFDENTLDNEL
jgi:hypothetical protein